MEDIEGLSNIELKGLILGRLRELGVDCDSIEIDVLKGPRIMLSGNVDYDSQRKLIKRTIVDTTGIADIIDELMVSPDLGEDLAEDERYPGNGSYDRDEEYMGTEDAFRSIEDGIPYIPPTSPTSQDFSETARRKRKRKNRGNTE